MKVCFIGILLLMSSFVVVAQSAEETQIRKLEAMSSEAFLKADTITLAKLWSPKFVVQNPFNRIVTVQDIKRLMTTQKITQVKFTSVIDKVTINENIAIVMGLETPDTTTAAAGVATQVMHPRRFTNIWMKTKGTWEQIARQATNICP